MTELAYPRGALRGDYVRAALGLLLTIGPALAIPWSSPANLVLVPGACLFAIFTIRTWRRQQSRVIVNDDGISIFGVRHVSLDWAKINAVKLSYFSTRRDRSGGWMQLKLRGEDPRRPNHACTIRVDSTLEGFDAVARRAAAAVTTNRIAISPATRVNFAAMGIDWLDVSTGELIHAGEEPVREHG